MFVQTVNLTHLALRECVCRDFTVGKFMSRNLSLTMVCDTLYGFNVIVNFSARSVP